MSDRYNIDSHKLIYHPQRVSQWLAADNQWSGLKTTYPIYVEITPIGSCNHRCTFCSVDYIGYKTISQDEAVLKRTITQMAEKGVKSIMFAGEGEPTLYKPLKNVLNHCKEVGIDSSLTTNFVQLDDETIESIVDACSWVKVSINGGTAESYAQIHQTTSRHFDQALQNLEKAIIMRQKRKSSCTFGAQLLLLPENRETIIPLAKKLKAIGVDYLVIKPYTQSLYGISRQYENLKYDDMMYLQEELDAIKSDAFNIIFRERTMNKLHEEKQPYDKCYSTPNFWAYVMANGDVYGCGAYLENDKFNYGNINNDSFEAIWEGSKRQEAVRYMRDELDISQCRKNCRMDEVNRYLWDLKHPSPHVNFI